MTKIMSLLKQGMLLVGTVCLFLTPLYSLQAQDWELVWADEFDGTAVDLEKWSFQIGTGCDINLCGWGNNELEYYRAENARVEDGHLIITARREPFGGADYTSTRMRTINKGDWTYGRFEMRAKLPTGQGLWPAFWMLPTDNVYGGWAASGEIDIMELVGHEAHKVHGTIHYGGAWPNNTFTGTDYTLSAGTFASDFHEFALEWEEGVIRWYVDGMLYQTLTAWSSQGHPFPAPFDQRFHLLLNVAVGGNWPGNPDATTVFPQEMVVDYVRVYQRSQSTATEEEEPYPEGAALLDAYPNPFQEAITIRYQIDQPETVALEVVNVLGQPALSRLEGVKAPGVHTIQVDAHTMPAGVYLYRLLIGDQVLQNTMIRVSL